MLPSSTCYLALLFSIFLVVGRASTNALTKVQKGTDRMTFDNPMVSPDTYYTEIFFESAYDIPPQIIVYISNMSIYRGDQQDYLVIAQDITTVGFTLKYNSENLQNQLSIQAEWIAFEGTSDAEVQQVNFKTVVLNDSSYYADTRVDTLTVTFQNTYDEVPNINLFLIGVMSRRNSEDSIKLEFSSVTTTSAKITITIWYFNIIQELTFTALITRKRMCISQQGSYDNGGTGSDPWMNTWDNDRELTFSQTTSSSLDPSDVTSDQPYVFTGINGYEVRSNTWTNLKISSTFFNATSKVFKQNVQVWGPSTVRQGYWSSCACNMAFYRAPEEDSDSDWWIYLVIVLAALLLLLLLLLLWRWCKNRKNRSDDYSDPAEKKGEKLDQTTDNNNTQSNLKDDKNKSNGKGGKGKNDNTANQSNNYDDSTYYDAKNHNSNVKESAKAPPNPSKNNSPSKPVNSRRRYNDKSGKEIEFQL